MPARYSRISWSTSSTVSLTTYLVPSTRKATVSGWPSTRSMRSGLSANRSPLRRVTRITGRSFGSVGWKTPMAGAGATLLSSARRGRPLSRTARSPRQADRAVPHPGEEPRRRRVPPSAALLLHVDQLVEDLVGRGDHLAVRLESALGDDQPGELLRQVDVGHLQ